MSLQLWQRPHRAIFTAAIVFGGCIGAVAGIRPVDVSINQDFYWLWLGLWIGSGCLIGAAVGVIRQSMRHS